TARTLATRGTIQGATAGPPTATDPPAVAGPQVTSAHQMRITDQAAYAGHCAQATPQPAAAAGGHRALVRKQAQIRALYDPDPMDEAIPRPRPPGEPDGSDPGELAQWVGKKITRPSKGGVTSGLGVTGG